MQPIRIKRAAMAAAAVLAVTVVVLFGQNLSSTQTASAADNPIVYKSLFLEKCSACHNAPDPRVTQYTRQQWRNTVDRMLNKHQASDSISPTEADQIVEFLGLFPPTTAPANNSPLATKAADVWSSEPTKTVVYTFSSSNQLAAFHAQRGAWALSPAQTTLTSRPFLQQTEAQSGDTGSAIFMNTADRASGDIDIQTQFRYLPNSADQTVGLILGAADNRNFYVVRFDAAKATLSVVEDKDGDFSVVTTAPTGDLAIPPDGWHGIRAIYHGDTQLLTVWLDANKKVVVKLPDWTDNAAFGLMTQAGTTAGFRNLTVDMYPASTAGA